MTIQKKITTVQVVEVEIDFPFFSKDKHVFAKVINQDLVLRVWPYSNQIDVGCATDTALNAEPITEAEFCEVYAKVMHELNRLANIEYHQLQEV